MVQDDREHDTTINDIEYILKYVPTSKTSGYVKLRLSAREFPADEVRVRTYTVQQAEEE